MLAPTLLQSIYDLPVDDKLSLLALISQMLQRDLSHRNEIVFPKGYAKPPHVLGPQQDMKTIIAELFSRPNPTPEQMIPHGLWAGMFTVDEEDFKLAEWHPSEEELTGG